MTSRDYRRILVTGGAGFIGSCYVRDVLARGDGTRITVLDKLTYAGNRSNLADVEADPGRSARFTFVQGDIADADVVGPLVADADAVVNFAAESHVDRSILDPEAFIRTGVVGVHVLLEAVRAASAGRSEPVRFLQVSTDEVYGSVEQGHSVETDRLEPRSPYSAVKAAGELLVSSYVATHGVDAVVTRGANTYGPYHHPEKLIPLFLTNALDDQPLPLYGDGLQRRDYIHIDDAVAALLRMAESPASVGRIYNVGSGVGTPLVDMAHAIRSAAGSGRIEHVPWPAIAAEIETGDFVADLTRIREELGWQPAVPLAEGLARTISHYKAQLAGAPEAASYGTAADSVRES